MQINKTGVGNDFTDGETETDTNKKEPTFFLLLL